MASWFERNESFKIAVQQRDFRLEPRYAKNHSRCSLPFFNKMIRTIANHFLSDERDRKFYADQYSCCPPPFFIILITLVEVRQNLVYKQSKFSLI